MSAWFKTAKDHLPGIVGGAVLSAALLLYGGGAAAKDGDGVFAVRGVGQLPCRALTDPEDQRPTLPYLIAGWIDGYVTSLNRTTEATFDIMPWQHTELLLDMLLQHCAKFPDQALSRAIHLMTTAMSATSLASQSELETFNAPEGEAQVYREVLRLAQSRLAELGHYTSTVDGRFGPGTAAAISVFQKEQGLPETGLPDQITLLRLFEPLFGS